MASLWWRKIECLLYKYVLSFLILNSFVSFHVQTSTSSIGALCSALPVWVYVVGCRAIGLLNLKFLGLYRDKWAYIYFTLISAGGLCRPADWLGPWEEMDSSEQRKEKKGIITVHHEYTIYRTGSKNLE